MRFGLTHYLGQPIVPAYSSIGRHLESILALMPVGPVRNANLVHPCLRGKVNLVKMPPFDTEALVEAYARHDARLNCGKGYSESLDSGELGWRESRILMDYVKLFRVTRDTGWLDKVVAHSDRIFGNMADHFGDGHGTWVTPTFSVGLLRTGQMHNRGTGRISPDEERVWVTHGGGVVEDGERIVEFERGRAYRIFEYGTRRVVARGSYKPGSPIPALSPFSVTVSGRPKPGDRFWVQTCAGEPAEWIVHQGMFLYPISQFVELVQKNRELRASYGGAASRYLRLIGKQIADKHERDWVDTTRTAGAYRVTPNRTERFPNRLLPHNMYLAMARAYVVLKDVSRKRLYIDRAERMARNFKRALRKTGRAYTWNYWDWTENGEPQHSGVEDIGHGRLDVGFVVEACRRGVVFRDTDLQRFACTMLDQMWNGSMENPEMGARVDTCRGGGKSTIWDWIDLCQWHEKVWEVNWALFCKLGQPVEEIASILQGWERLQEGKGRKRRH